MGKYQTREDRRWGIAANVVMIILSLLAVLPFILLIVASVSSEYAVTNYGYSFFPKELSLAAYQYLFDEIGQIGRAYLITIITTVVGTVTSLYITAAFAFATTREQVRGTKLMFLMVIITMLFNGGIVSTYYVYNNVFHIKNTIFALIIPSLLMSAFNVVLIRNYFRFNIPSELLEAAAIDGAGQFRIFFQICTPLSTPILATIGLLTGISYWNDWNNGLYYITDARLYSIQVLLNKMNESVTFLQANSSEVNNLDLSSLPTSTMRMAVAVVAILPILVIYPFFQKYFAKGITMGAVKG